MSPESMPPAEWLEGPVVAEAAPQVATVYREVADHLRVPYLGPFWRALAWDADAFGRIWAALSPALASDAFEREAAALRRAALIDEAASMSSHQAFRGDLARAEIDFDMRDKIANYNAAVHYALAKNLLAAALLLRLLDGADAGPPTGGAGAPFGVAPAAVFVPPVPLEQARGRVAELFAEIAPAHHQPVLDEYYRAIARAGDYLNAAWNAIRPVVGDPYYDERAAALAAAAATAAARLPAKAGADLALNDAGEARLRTVLGYFAGRHLPTMLIDLSLIRALTDGPEHVEPSPYDVDA